MRNASLKNTHLVPVKIVKVGRFLLVHLARPERLQLSRGFFRDALPAEVTADRIIGLDQWLMEQKSNSSNMRFGDTCCIFHVARCGSTLLANNIRSNGASVVLSEPAFVGKLRKILEDQEPDLWADTLQCMIGVWQSWAGLQKKKLVIKFNSLMHENQTEIMNSLPGCRFLFLYREPVAVLESLLRKKPKYIQNEWVGTDLDMVDELKELSQSGPEINATQHYCNAIRKFTSFKHTDFISVSYDALQDQFPSIMTYFRFETEEKDLNWESGTYAKSRDGIEKAYIPVSTEIVEKFASENAECLAVAQRYYDAFLRLNPMLCVHP